MPESRPDSCEKQAYLSSYSSAEKIPWAWVDTDGWMEGGRKGRKVKLSRSDSKSKFGSAATAATGEKKSE